jgi:hypothetical protein
MGSFSWLRADRCTKRANLTIRDKYKILIPIEFGGGYIEDTYYDYGYINYYKDAVYVDKDGKKTSLEAEGDLYGMLALMNMRCTRVNKGIESDIVDIIENGDTCGDIRHEGIDIGCYDSDMSTLQFPLKLVSRSCEGTYEQLNHFSCSDPNQGFYATEWDDKIGFGHDDDTYLDLYEEHSFCEYNKI